MRINALLLCFFLSVAGFAQTGNYFLSHFSPDEEQSNITCFDIVQDSRGIFYFATQAGVLQFDGRNWDIIATNGALYSIAISEEGDIYVGGSEGFGKIIRDEFGMEVYQPLFKQKETEYIFQIITTKEDVFFLSENTIFRYDPTTGNITPTRSTAATGEFIALHEIWGRAYVSTENIGLVEIKGFSLDDTALGISDSVTIIFSLKYKNQYLLGSDDNKIYLTDDSKVIKEVPLKDAAYANASVIVTATWVKENLIALGTLRGGVMFVNPQTGDTEEISNYNTGLPDNEVFALVTDKNQNVWAAHSYGFTRIAPYLPFRSFRYYPGLKGNLLCATTYNGIVYVGTSEGLFRLEKEEFFDEIVYYVEIPVTRVITKGQEKEPLAVVEETQSKKGLFGFLKKKKKKEEESLVAPSKGEDKAIVKEFRREKRSKKILRKSHYTYKPVEGVDSKISQLFHWKGKLIAAGLGGAFEVGSTPSVITEQPIRFLFASEKLNRLIAATHDDELRQFEFKKEWSEGEQITGINSPVNYIFEEDTAALWFCGFDKLFRMKLSGKDQSITSLFLGKENFSQPSGIYLNNQVFIAASSGFYFYDQNKQQLIEGDSTRKPVAYFASASNLWFRDAHNWYTAGSAGGHNNLQLLNLFNNLRYINTDFQLKNLWIITGNNELLQFNSEAVRKDETLYPLILKSIENNQLLIPRKSFVKINQDESSLEVEVVRPDFIGAKLVEYRYMLEGLTTEWSEWSAGNNIVNFPYLPTGNYKLHVQSRDIFGRTNELDAVAIDVVPPYWKQTWFYAAEFSVFLFLVILSFRLSYRFIFISRLLSLLSIIIFIEFIQTIAGSTFSTQSTPVLDFIIQVGVAFVVLPVEGFLRRYFLQAITKRNQAKLQEITGTDEEELKNPKKTT